MAVKKGSALNYIHQNHLGSTSVVSSTDGTPVATMKFMPFGVCRISTGNLPTDKLFTGQRRDIATPGSELYYYGARYYDPEIGRFISPDTIVQDHYNPQCFNRYSYCSNNPLRYIDPSGNYIQVIGAFAIAAMRYIIGAAAAYMGAVFVRNLAVTIMAAYDYNNSYMNTDPIQNPKQSKDPEKIPPGYEIAYIVVGGATLVVFVIFRTSDSSEYALPQLPIEKEPKSTTPSSTETPSKLIGPVNPKLRTISPTGSLGKGGKPYIGCTPTLIGDTGFKVWGVTPDGSPVVAINDPGSSDAGDW